MTEAVKSTPRSDARELGLRALRLLAMGAVVFALEAFLDAYRLAALLMGAFAVEFLSGKAGLRWDETGSKSMLQSLRVGALGFALGALSVLLVVGGGAAFGLVRVSLGAPTLVGAGMGLAMALAQAARDEVLFRGAPLALMRGKIADRWALPFVALLGAAPLLAHPDPSLPGIATVVVTGWIFALAWRVGKGMPLAFGAHAGWLFMMGAGSRGSVLDVSLGAGQLLPPVDATGGIAWLAVATFVIAAIAISLGYYRLAPRG